MKKLILSLLVFGALPLLADDTQMTLEQFCDKAMADVSDCVYNNKQLAGDQLKVACETSIRNFIFEYHEHSCHSSHSVAGSFLRADMTLKEALQDLVDLGRTKDERAKAAQEKTDRSREDRKKMFNSVQIN